MKHKKLTSRHLLDIVCSCHWVLPGWCLIVILGIFWGLVWASPRSNICFKDASVPVLDYSQAVPHSQTMMYTMNNTYAVIRGCEGRW